MNEAELMLIELAEQLERWAKESRSGGWSTHQIEPMNNKAKDIWVFIGKQKAKLRKA